MTIKEACDGALRDALRARPGSAALAEYADSLERDADKLDAATEIPEHKAWAAAYRDMAGRIRAAMQP